MRFPLRNRPLRNPGQTLDNDVSEVMLGKCIFPASVALALVLLAAWEWLRWAVPTRPMPLPFTLFAVIAVVVAAIRVRAALPIVRRLKLGRDGERAVGQTLEELRASGAFVLHDIPGDDFNLDHVVIHPSGIYAVETKTRRKPDRGQTKLYYDGTAVKGDDWPPDSAPIIQAKAAANWLSGLLQDSTGRSFPVKPVVLYPGWFVVNTGDAKSADVWVLNEKAFLKFVPNSAVKMAAEDVNLCNQHLGLYVRAKDANG